MSNNSVAAQLAAGLLTTGTAQAQNVGIYLIDMLDSTQNGYWLTIAGGREADAEPAEGSQARTCSHESE